MAPRVYENWERLVRATLQREQLRRAGGTAGKPTAGLAAAVPPSLGKQTNIDAILQAADDIEDEDPNVARILCEQAYSMAQNLDPSSEGRGVLQFKTGLMSVIKQKLAKKDGEIDRQHDIERLWKFYVAYKRRHRVDDIQKEQQRLLESGNFSTTNLGELESRAGEMKKVYATLRVLIDVLEVLVRDSSSDGMGKLIMEEVRKIKKSDATLGGESTPYNIVPFEAPSLTNILGFFPEVRAAISAIGYTSEFPRVPADFEVPRLKTLDMFDLLEFVFGFQKDNIQNQRENVVLALANAQARLGLPVEAEPKIDEKAITEVFLKVLANYIKWCKYLGVRIAWNSIEAVNKNRKLILISLYFLIWGEAANVRFLPECICYIFHHMAKELDAILDQPEAIPAKSCTSSEGVVTYLQEIITPIYETLLAEAARNNNGKAAHSAWRNYDDFNEYFWSRSCFELSWPPKKDSSFLRKPMKRKRTGKTSFVEHRTFFHLYRSFHRLWIFLFLMFQVLTIIAFHKGNINLSTFKVALSVGPAFFILNFVKSCLDILLMFGAYSTARGFAISRLIIRFFWLGISSAFVMYLYLKVMDERNSRNSDSTYFRIYILVLGVYTAIRIVFALLAKIPALHTVSEFSDRWRFFQFFKWIYQERYFVGRGLYEKTSDYSRYVLFWLVIFACKFTFAYYLQVKPLVQPTDIIVKLHDLRYSWHDLVSKGNKNALTLLSLWAPVFAIYLMDIHIWYTLMSALVGGLIGARARMGEIRSLEMLQKRFESFPEAFVKNLVSSEAKGIPPNRQYAQEPQDMSKSYASLFSPFWNDIIKSLREEDYISNREMDLLCIPSNSGSLRLVQWPLFLLTSKIMKAQAYAEDCKDNQANLWSRISRDEYMAYAVQECYYSAEKILHSIVDGEGRLWVERLFRELNNSISEHSLTVTITLKNLSLLVKKFTALTGLLIRDETPGRAEGAPKAVSELYDVITHDLLTSNLREQFDTWNILARARNEGRLFSRIQWPRDPEIKEQVKRLHLLLTVKESAENIPKNLEARRRLEFFTNSLFMDMPPAKPVSEMMPFSVFTPYYSETVLYSSSELRQENEDGISILFYLQKIFPDEWENFLERIGRGESTAEALQKSSSDTLELRFWASYRGQTLARTVRGMMYYRRALMLQSYLEKRYLGGIEDGFSGADYINTQGYELSSESRAQADLKFTYVVSCQIYGQQKQKKAPEAADIALLMQRNEALRVAFIHAEEHTAQDGKVSKEFYSKLVKADVHGKDQEIYSIKLPGDPKLGEGKPENQNHAIIFTRGDAIQTIDMNQDNYLEEAMKMRNLLEEFRGNHGLRCPTILGVREHVFTGSVSSLAWFMSNQETSFVTLGQRVLAYPLKVRMHYGHPDVFDRIFHITRGGISKASRVINISEDIYAGFNSTLRQGNITHHEYIQVGKGRDVGLNQIALFEGKVAQRPRLSASTNTENSYLEEQTRSFESYMTAIGSSSYEDSPDIDEAELEMRRLKLELKMAVDKYEHASQKAYSGKADVIPTMGDRCLRTSEMNKKEEKRSGIQATERTMEFVSGNAIDRVLPKLGNKFSSDVQFKKYSIEEIRKVTNNFSESLKVGEGGYGPVFKSTLDQIPVAIKIPRPDVARGMEQFQQEVEVLSSIRHPNLVLLVGACPEHGCLVYEYMANGNLEDRIFCKSGSAPLPWQLRFKIAAEIASALLYLHQTKPEPLVHRDLKPANILLDENFVSKITDVGLARLLPTNTSTCSSQYLATAAAGTFCYIDPEYQKSGTVGVKSDVYALGIILLQLITARPPMGLAHHVENAMEMDKFEEMLDPNVPDWPVEEAMKLAKMGMMCAELRRRDRPDLGSVVLPELYRLLEFAESSL